jgi:hypothetical protein
VVDDCQEVEHKNIKSLEQEKTEYQENTEHKFDLLCCSEVV